jgi:N-dimethylarginine dimethylaminohydrolase
MKHAVLLADPSFFEIKIGKNPYTRTRFGFRKKVDLPKAIAQWKILKETLENLGARALVAGPHKECPSMVFCANAGFLFPKYAPIPWKDKKFYLSRPLHRARETEIYRDFFKRLGIPTATVSHAFEGEADFFECGDFHIFTYGKIAPTGFRPRLGWPPYFYQSSHRSDERVLPELERVVSPRPILKLRLTDTRYYHGDTALFAFGKNRENLLAYLPAFSPQSVEDLKKHLGKKLIAISQKDAEAFAANSFQLDTASGPCVVLPQGVSGELEKTIQTLGCRTQAVDVSEFFEKGGGSVKCLISDLGPVADE